MDDPALLYGCIAGAATVQENEAWLAEAGFVNIRVTTKAESGGLIATWFLAPADQITEREPDRAGNQHGGQRFLRAY